MWTVKEIDQIEWEMMFGLGCVLRKPGEDLGGRLEKWEREWTGRKMKNG